MSGSPVIHSETFAVDASEPAGGEADHVPFGEDADRAVVVVDDDDRADLSVAHALRGNGNGLGRLRGHDRVRHDVGNGALARNGGGGGVAHRRKV